MHVFLDVDDVLLKMKDNFFLVKKELNDIESIYSIFIELENNDFRLHSKSGNLDFIENEFYLISNENIKNKQKIFFREDTIGYPNYSIIAFSLNEQPTIRENIVYYEYDHNLGILKRDESTIDFAKSTRIVNNNNGLNLLKEKLSNYFPIYEESSRLSLKKWNNKNIYEIGDMIRIKNKSIENTEILDLEYSIKEDRWIYKIEYENSYSYIYEREIRLNKNKDEIEVELINEQLNDSYLDGFDI